MLDLFVQIIRWKLSICDFEIDEETEAKPNRSLIDPRVAAEIEVW